MIEIRLRITESPPPPGLPATARCMECTRKVWLQGPRHPGGRIICMPCVEEALKAHDRELSGAPQ